MLSPIQQFRQEYEIGDEIGRGAFAICYKATNKTSHMVVAAKKISIITQDELMVQSISNEIHLLKSLNHPNIIKYIGAYGNKNELFILTQYGEDGDLQDKIFELKRQKKRLTQDQVMSILKQVLEGLAYLHSKNVMHRDIKPSNIFISQFNQIKIGDLGSSKIFQQFNFTRVGTPYYLPPQVIRHQNYSFSADIWSLGVTLYHLVFLQLPFKASNIIKLGQQIVGLEPKYHPHICSHRVQQVIRKMLVKNEKERPSANQLLQNYFIQKVQNGIFQIMMLQGDLKQQEQTIKKHKKDGSALLQMFSKQLGQQNINQQVQKKKEIAVRQILIQQNMQESLQNQDIKQKNNLFVPSPRLDVKEFSKINHIEPSVFDSQIDKQTIDENESTIVLTASPAFFKHQSSVIRQNNQKNSLLSNMKIAAKNYRKSISFNNMVKLDSPSKCNFAQLKISKIAQNNWENVYVHKRQTSGIQKRLKHSQLMQKIKPLKAQSPFEYQNPAHKQRKQKAQIKVNAPSFVLIR